MKSHFISVFFVLLSLSGFSNNSYVLMMSKSIEKLFQASSIPEYIEVANQFERISKIETEEWLPLYYSSFAYVMISFQETENARKDAALDQAQKCLDQAFRIESGESELYVLQAFIYPSRINIDPMGRGAIYMGALNKSLEQALGLNSENPRAYYLRATMTLHMPEAFGGGAAKALPLLLLAKEKFEHFQPKSAIHPNWGKEMCDTELEKITAVKPM